jgi:hypothetical protein
MPRDQSHQTAQARPSRSELQNPTRSPVACLAAFEIRVDRGVRLDRGVRWIEESGRIEDSGFRLDSGCWIRDWIRD